MTLSFALAFFVTPAVLGNKNEYIFDVAVCYDIFIFCIFNCILFEVNFLALCRIHFHSSGFYAVYKYCISLTILFFYLLVSFGWSSHIKVIVTNDGVADDEVCVCVYVSILVCVCKFIFIVSWSLF